ncbi:hypothetical protein P8452_20894 [Trifolium repens]|nr:hypothetical protein P8452_20894 [Trifolium repens]
MTGGKKRSDLVNPLAVYITCCDLHMERIVTTQTLSLSISHRNQLPFSLFKPQTQETFETLLSRVFQAQIETQTEDTPADTRRVEPVCSRQWIIYNWLGLITMLPSDLFVSFDTFGFPFKCKKLMVPACVVDGALKEYLRPTRGEIRCDVYLNYGDDNGDLYLYLVVKMRLFQVAVKMMKIRNILKVSFMGDLRLFSTYLERGTLKYQELSAQTNLTIDDLPPRVDWRETNILSPVHDQVKSGGDSDIIKSIHGEQ